MKVIRTTSDNFHIALLASIAAGTLVSCEGSEAEVLEGPSAIAIHFAGLKKSVATSVHMAQILFSGRTAGAIVALPMFRRQNQSGRCESLAQRLGGSEKAVLRKA